MTTIYLVTYTDEFGPYAQAFSTRAYAEAFVASFSRPDDFTIIETVVDRSLVLAREPLEQYAPAGRGRLLR